MIYKPSLIHLNWVVKMARQLTSIVLLITPVFVLNALRIIVTPLGDMMSVSDYLTIGLNGGSILVGIMLFRKTRVVRDHEWRRSKAIKSVEGHFKAEDRGVWNKELEMESGLSAEGQANLKGDVASVVGIGSPLVSNDVDTEVEVEMLIDSEHVRKAQARVSGDEQFDGETPDSTIGAVRKNSPMDSFLDWISSLFGKDKKSQRSRVKNQQLIERSKQSPVIAQRPIAPTQPIKSEARRPRAMEIISVTDSGMESVTINEETNEISVPIIREATIEEMAFGKVKEPILGQQTGFAPQPTCRVCNNPNPVGERFCLNCGSDLN